MQNIQIIGLDECNYKPNTILSSMHMTSHNIDRTFFGNTAATNVQIIMTTSSKDEIPLDNFT